MLQLEVRLFERLVQIMKSHISPCWELDPSVTGLPGWKRGYVLGKPGGRVAAFQRVLASTGAPALYLRLGRQPP